MKSQKIIYIAIFSLLLIACEKVDSDVNMRLETLNGTWHLVGYMNADNTILLSEPSDLLRPIIMHLEDNMDSGVMFGHTVVNCVQGNYMLTTRNQMTVPVFGGTKVGEPKWGSMFWDAVRNSKSYSVESKHMKIYYDDNKYMLFEKTTESFRNLYWDQTLCSDLWNINEKTTINATTDSLK